MQDLLLAAKQGVDTLILPQSVKEQVAIFFERWCTDEAYSSYLPQLQHLVKSEQFDELADAFYRVLPFGTGGRRGRVGVGPNRINTQAVQSSAQGHADWLFERFPSQELSVVIAYDVRCFQDQAGVFNKALPNPVAGLSSRKLAEVAAQIYAANGITAHLLSRDSHGWTSTPELSYAISALSAHGGLNLSASHNPPDDNGVKVYDRRGCQLVPPDDEHLLTSVAAVSELKTVTWDAGVESGKIQFLPPTIHQGYVSTIASQVVKKPRGIRCRYTPLHGTGCVEEILEAAGFECERFAPQANADGAFSTVPGNVANPENPEAMALSLADHPNVSLVFGTDPDADRIGCEVRHNGEFVHLTGNDIAVLVVDAALAAHEGKTTPLVIRTEVTTGLLNPLASAFHAEIIDDLLVGFKYIGDVLRALDEEGAYGALSADELTFVAGVEESHGVLITDQLRDKDAAGGALLLAVRADELNKQGKTLIDRLHEIQFQYGYFINGQFSIRFEGATGADRMAKVLNLLREDAPIELAGRTVLSFTDHQNENGRYGTFLCTSDKNSRNVLVIKLDSTQHDDGAKLILRPSGTEPKLKIYMEISGKPALGTEGRADVQEQYRNLQTAASKQLSSLA